MSRLIKSTLTRLPVGISFHLLNLLSSVLPVDNYQGLRSWWYDRFYDGRPIHIRGLKFHLHAKEVVSRQLFKHGYFDNEISKALQQLAPHCGVFMDIGANIGAMTVHVGVNSELPILAFEPVKSNYELLKANVTANGLAKQVQIHQVALGEQSGEIPIYLSANNKGDHRIHRMDDEMRDVEMVTIKRLDDVDFSQFQPPYLIKIDVQGYEPFVLRGAQKTLSQPCYIMMEVWPNGLTISNSSVDELNNICADLGLSIYTFDDSGIPISVKHLSELTDALPERYGAHVDVLLTNQSADTIQSIFHN